MAIRYGCFLSYAHGQHGLMRRFILNLSDAIKCYLEPYLDSEELVFMDSEHFAGGDDIDSDLARALCESVCMIAIYTPKYEAHDYCRREYAAMLQIEQERRRWLPVPGHLIIPVIMTQHPLGLPSQIAGPGYYLDFSGFTLASEDLRSNPQFLPDIDGMVRRIARHYYYLKRYMPPTHDCNQFVLPAVPPLWRASPSIHSLEK